MNRRTFVSNLAIAGTAAALPRSVFGAASSARPKVGLIGCGWFGGGNLDVLSRAAEIDIVSLCDPNAHALAAVLESVKSKQGQTPATFANYREMLAANPHDIVIVATPDHWHALPAIEAMQAGADVFLEKPVSLDVMEGEAMLAAARKYKRVVQVNLQRRNTPLFDEARERFIESGKLGRVGLAQCFFYGGGNGEVIAPVPPPTHLDYDLWAGPAPKVEYVPPIESRGWRMFREYGNGTIGDMGVHIFDLVRALLGLRWPDSISSTGGRYVYKDATANISDTQTTTFHYPDLDVSWHHRHWGESPIPRGHWTDQWGATIIGEKGTLHVTTLSYAFEPADGGSRVGRHLLSKTGDLENIGTDAFGPRYDEIALRHGKDFMSARESRSRPLSDIEEGHISSACCILGNLALELGRPLAYDPNSRSVRNDPEATLRLERPYRSSWIHPRPDSV